LKGSRLFFRVSRSLLFTEDNKEGLTSPLRPLRLKTQDIRALLQCTCTRALTGMVQGGFFLKEKPLEYVRHINAYVNNLNVATAAHPELAGKFLEDLVTNSSTLPEGARRRRR
jgi:hypothetical protein